MNRRVVLCGAAASLALAGAWSAMIDFSARAQTTQAAISAAPLVPVTETAEGRVMGDIIIGDPNAPVTVVEYASLTCPHCANFHNNTYPAIKEKYVDAGKVNFVVREVYFDQFGLLAAAVARCGGEQRYEKFLDVFYKNQREWTGSGDRATIISSIRRIGLLGGLTPAKVDACLTDREYHRPLVEHFQATTEADGVRSTPFFFVNGQEVRGAVGVDEMSAAIDAQLP